MTRYKRIELNREVIRRLEEEARKRGCTVDKLINELLDEMERRN